VNLITGKGNSPNKEGAAAEKADAAAMELLTLLEAEKQGSAKAAAKKKKKKNNKKKQAAMENGSDDTSSVRDARQQRSFVALTSPFCLHTHPWPRPWSC
jgi:hypothetical protein